MITSLTIQNYAIIDSLEIEFRKGFSVITGETGAGKSIMLGALGLVLGQRVESKIFRDSNKKCVIEVHFDTTSYNFQPFFEEEELEYDPYSCIIRREIQPGGKSRAFVNDVPVQLNILKELGSRLIDIHSQHQNLLLSDPLYQLNVLDSLTPEKDCLAAYKILFGSYKKVKTELAKLRSAEKQGRQDEEYCRFQYNQLDEANIKEGELEALEIEQEELSHAGEIKNGFLSVDNLLSEDDTGILPRLKSALSELRNVAKVYTKANELTERLETDYIDLKDIASEAAALGERLEDDPQRLQWVDERIALIYSLMQKHRVKHADELVTLHKELQEKLTLLSNFDQAIADKEREVEQSKQQLEAVAAQLTILRRVAADLLEQTIVEKVSQLAIPNIRFEVSFVPKEEPDETGANDIAYLFAANKNAPLLPVVDTASGGEISRMMLCIKALVASTTAMPSIIFDEIDTGVSGDVADRMGDIMNEMAQHMQVITITHLPQIAAKGSGHYRVYKEDTDDSTFTNIVPLSSEERIYEIARMLSGSQLTEAAVANAKELLTH